MDKLGLSIQPNTLMTTQQKLQRIRPSTAPRQTQQQMATNGMSSKGHSCQPGETNTNHWKLKWHRESAAFQNWDSLILLNLFPKCITKIQTI